MANARKHPLPSAEALASQLAYFMHKAAIRAAYEQMRKGLTIIEDRDENGALWRVRAIRGDDA